MADLSDSDIEIRAIREAYDALKCLDPTGRHRAMEWLYSKFMAEEQEGRAARHQATLRRLAQGKKSEPTP